MHGKAATCRKHTNPKRQRGSSLADQLIALRGASPYLGGAFEAGKYQLCLHPAAHAAMGPDPRRQAGQPPAPVDPLTKPPLDLLAILQQLVGKSWKRVFGQLHRAQAAGALLAMAGPVTGPIPTPGH